MSHSECDLFESAAWACLHVGYRDDAFHHGRVRQLWHARYDVANGVQAFFCRFHVLADVKQIRAPASLSDFSRPQFSVIGMRPTASKSFFRLQRLLFSILGP